VLQEPILTDPLVVGKVLEVVGKELEQGRQLEEVVEVEVEYLLLELEQGQMREKQLLTFQILQHYILRKVALNAL
jgi:hypothetical protein